jgi:hypothetical protein
MEPAERIAELETELKRRDDKIKELTTEQDEAQELVDRQREHVDDASQLIEGWIEAFDMHQSDDGLWCFDEASSVHFQAYDRLLEGHRKLIREWNKFVAEYNAVIRPRERGRPIAASASASRGRQASQDRAGPPRHRRHNRTRAAHRLHHPRQEQAARPYQQTHQ